MAENRERERERDRALDENDDAESKAGENRADETGGTEKGKRVITGVR